MKFIWVCYLVVIKIRLLLSHRDIETGTFQRLVGMNGKFFGYLAFSQAGTSRGARVILESGLEL